MDTSEGLSFNEIRSLKKSLQAAQWISKELEVQITRQSQTGSPYRDGGKSNETPLVFDDKASEASWILRNTLRAWSSEVSCICVVPMRPCTEQMPTGTTEHVAQWLESRVLRLQPYRDAYEEISEAVDQALEAIDRPVSKIYLGECSCGQRLYGDPMADRIECWACGYTYEPKVLRAANIERGRDLMVTAKEAQRYIGTIYGIALTARRIRAWGRGKIERHGEDSVTGETLYRLGDIVDTATASNRLRRSG